MSSELRLIAASKHFRRQPTWAELLRVRRAPPLVRALSEITATFRAGEATAVLGHNGAGKTTLLKLCAGLLLPSAGAVERPELGCAYVGGGARSFFFRLTGRENLRFFAALHGLFDRSADARTDELASLLGLGASLDRPVREYSAGMAQRLVLARGLLQPRAVLLLDEVTAGLDLAVRRRLLAFIRRDLVEQRGVCVLLSTHLPEDVRALCTRALWLHGGALRSDGAALPILAELEREVVAQVDASEATP